MRRLWWIFPDRSSTKQRRWADGKYWNEYRVEAATCGLDLACFDPGSLVADGLVRTRPSVFVDGTQMDPADTIFVTQVYTFPYHIGDTFNAISPRATSGCRADGSGPRGVIS